MSATLGEKLRQAREERGMTISEVAEHTRISPLYIESIEKDDYRPLPGGIFNKGFVKSYAKYVGLDEQEALRDYAEIVASTGVQVEEPPRPYRPEVWTDDRNISSLAPTLVLAGVILALMTAGILFAVNYYRNRQTETPTAANTTNTSPENSETTTPAGPAQPTAGAPSFESSRFEFRAENEPVWLSHSVDGRRSQTEVKAGQSLVFEPKESLTLSYHRSRVPYVSLTANGKQIQLPAEPTSEKRSTIDVEINKANFPGIWQAGRVISAEGLPRVTEANRSQRPSPARRPQASPARPAANTAAKPSPN